MRIKIPFIVIILVIALACMSGCTSNTTTTQNPEQTIPTTAIFTSTQTTVPLTIEQTLTPTQNITSNQTDITNSHPDPWVNSLKTEKGVLVYRLNNCIMKEYFPKYANDKGYGLKANPPKLDGISSGEWNTFIREHTEGKNENSKTITIDRCLNPEGESPSNPDWNFVRISTGLEPRNAIPSNYTIIFHLKAHGKEISQITMNEILDKNQPVFIQSYIPMRNDEIDLFDTATISFN